MMDGMLLAEISIDMAKDWVLHHGWWAGAFISFSALFLCGLGLPLPEDIPLIVTGAFLVQDPHGHVWQEWLIVGGLNWLGIMGGDCCLYWISRKLGRAVTQLPLIRNHITLERIDKVGHWFDQYGVGVVGVGRMFAGIRGAMVITAGISRFNFTKFIIADGLAAIVSGGLFMLLGHWVGDKLNDEVFHKFKHWFVIGAVALAVLVVAYIVWKRRRAHKAAEAPQDAVAAQTAGAKSE